MTYYEKVRKIVQQYERGILTTDEYESFLLVEAVLFVHGEEGVA